MNSNVQFIGIDVDDKAYHVSVFNNQDNSSFDFKCRPMPGFLLKAFRKHKVSPESKICYEASYIGYSLYRALQKHGYKCEIIASSLIPRQPGMKQKTDRIDSRKLAQYYAKDLLTVINIPDEIDEGVRDLLRSKSFLSQQLTKLKNHMTSMSRRLGFDYCQETNKKSRWTRDHLNWLQAKINKIEQKSVQLNFKILFKQFEDLRNSLELYEKEIDQFSLTERYYEKVKALKTFKGIKNESALTLITELGDIRRFDHPRRLVSYAGFDVVEYSSGGKEKKYGISKLGNSNIRRIAVDVTKFTIRSPIAGNDLRQRRKEIDPDLAKIASKCSTRLYKKGSRMLFSGKPTKKVQVACGREFLGFAWEMLTRLA